MAEPPPPPRNAKQAWLNCGDHRDHPDWYKLGTDWQRFNSWSESQCSRVTSERAGRVGGSVHVVCEPGVYVYWCANPMSLCLRKRVHVCISLWYASVYVSLHVPVVLCVCAIW